MRGVRAPSPKPAKIKATPMKAGGTGFHPGGPRSAGVGAPREPDPLSMAKRFLLYRHLFGEMGGSPGLNKMGGMGPVTGGVASGVGDNPIGLPGSTGAPGNLAGLATARRMGIL